MEKVDMYKEIAEKLWDLLDDISTISDVIKPTDIAGYKIFYRDALKKVGERCNYMYSPDGQRLEINEKWIDSKIIQKIESKGW